MCSNASSAGLSHISGGISLLSISPPTTNRADDVFSSDLFGYRGDKGGFEVGVGGTGTASLRSFIESFSSEDILKSSG